MAQNSLSSNEVQPKHHELIRRPKLSAYVTNHKEGDKHEAELKLFKRYMKYDNSPSSDVIHEKYHELLQSCVTYDKEGDEHEDELKFLEKQMKEVERKASYVKEYINFNSMQVKDNQESLKEFEVVMVDSESMVRFAVEHGYCIKMFKLHPDAASDEKVAIIKACRELGVSLVV